MRPIWIGARKFTLRSKLLRVLMLSGAGKTGAFDHPVGLG